ncbi:MAG: fucose isomerase [Bacilli bacterium]|nr:fucose isomerase [Bacilli bacterium]
MLKGLPKEINPDLLKVLSEMGHGDTILIADANFPAYSKGIKVIRADNIKVSAMLKAMLKLIPLDTFSNKSAVVMIKDEGMLPECSSTYQKIIDNVKEKIKVTGLFRNDFYVASTSCYAIVLTSDTTPYANIILRKGIID